MASSSSDLDALMQAIAISNGDIDNRQMDGLAEALQMKLGVDLPRGQMIQLANQLYRMKMEQNNNDEQVLQHTHSSSPHRGGAGSTSSFSFDNTRQRATNTSESAYASSAATTPTRGAAFHDQRSTSQPNLSFRGRSPARRAKPPPSGNTPNRDKTPVRGGLYGQHQGGATSPAPPLGRTGEGASRSLSPFHHNNGKKPSSQEDEKKDSDASSTDDSVSRAASGTVHSGRASPVVDPSAEPAIQPQRPPSPAHNKSNQSSPPRTAAGTEYVTGGGGTSSRPCSPYSRPGLQEADHGDQLFTQSPSRPNGYPTVDPMAKSRARSVTPRQTRPPSHDAGDSSQQPHIPGSSPLGAAGTPGHRKAHSDASLDHDSSYDSNLLVPQLGSHERPSLHHKGAYSDIPSSSMAGDEQLFTPPPRTNLPTSGGRTIDMESFPTDESVKQQQQKERNGRTPAVFSSIPVHGSQSSPLDAQQRHDVIGSPTHHGHASSSFSANLHPVSSFPRVVESIGGGFEIGVGPKNSRHGRFLRRQGKGTAGVAPSYAPARHPAAQPAVFSPPVPMEVEPIARTPPGVAAAQMAYANGDAQFSMGVSSKARQSKPKPRKKPWEIDHHHQMPSMAGATAESDRVHRQIAAYRSEARDLYVQKNYNASIQVYTRAIALFSDVAEGETNDVLAVLLSNRAACLILVGAFEAAKGDCQKGLTHVSIADANSDRRFSTDSGPLLRTKLLGRLARVQMRLGDHEAAVKIFKQTIAEANSAIKLTHQIHPPHQARSNEDILNPMITEATLGGSDARRLSDLTKNVHESTRQSRKNPDDRKSSTEALGCVNIALTMAPGSMMLYELKLQHLATLKRWREVASVCERLAASLVQLDGVFEGDLASRNPFPGVDPAKNLKPDHFGETREGSVDEVDYRFNSRCAAEGVLRLPQSMMPFYLRALRLEERYPAAEAAHRSLEEFIRGASPQQSLAFSWFKREVDKLARTKAMRENGDELFRLDNYNRAAAVYAACIKIDNEGIDSSGKSGGGRLHAVLHCNRAACLMAEKRFEEAIVDTTAAIRIHPCYMKAILRRSRCYARLNRFNEAVSEYTNYLNLVEEAHRGSTAFSSSPCLFDGPRDVSEQDVNQVHRELDEAQRGKRRAEAKKREEEQRRQWDSFSQGSWQSQGGGTSAYERRENWYNQKSDSRRWDSFSGRTPGGHSRSKSWGAERARQEANRSRSQRPQQEEQLAGSPRSDLTVDHYTVLEVQRNASESDIKKAYKKLALKYHPDKNNEESAADKFRRIKAAFDCLSNHSERRKYDAELRNATYSTSRYY